MDKIILYRKILHKIIDEMIALYKKARFHVKIQVIIDEQRGHFMLYQNDWVEHRRAYGGFLHLELSETGKVWIHHDGTDLVIGEILLEKGVEKQDLVLGFQPPFVREDTGFALG